MGGAGAGASAVSGALACGAGSGGSYVSRSVQFTSGCRVAFCTHGPRQISWSTPRSVMPAVPGMALALAKLASAPLALRVGGGSVTMTNVYIEGVCRCDRVYVDVEKL